MTPHRTAARVEHTLEVDVTALGSGGEGIARVDGSALLVAGALPGERWRVAHAGDRVATRPLERLTDAPGRVSPRCELFGRCGACAWQHADADLQQAARIELLRRALPPNLRSAVVSYVRSSETYGYRVRARMAWHTVKGRTSLGFRVRRSHDAVDVVSCPVLDPQLEAALDPLRATLAGTEGSGEVALVTGRDAAVVSLRPDGREPRREWFAWPEALVGGGLEGAVLWVPGASVATTAGERRGCVQGPDGQRLWVDPDGFAQGHGSLNAALVSHATSATAARDRTVLELFAGVGNFTVSLAREARRVTAIESDERSVDLLRENLAARGIENATAAVADAAEATARRKADVVLLDPPRAGAPEVCEALVAKRPKRVVYVSCDPASLGRDLGVLARAFTVREIRLFEMFPHTPHVETVVTLERSSGNR